MKIANLFTVGASPDEVFAYLLNVDQVVGCLPGAELTEVVDAQTFKGKLSLKAGAVKVAYSGTAAIVDTTETDDRAVVTVKANGREIGGQGAVRATLLLTVAPGAGGEGTDVGIDADFTVTGKLAQFGSGVIEDISRRLIKEMADCIEGRLQPRSKAAGA
jgi:carbon monoxide dehydrogenase subunit G